MKQKSLPVGRQGFTLIELLVVITILGILASIGLNTFTSAQRKSRDAKRKGHLKQITDALEAYYNDQEEYPDDSSGNIMGCGENALEECTFGETAFQNDDTETVYMLTMPGDPSTGSTYFYESFTEVGVRTKYQIYARLENSVDIDIPKDVDDNPQNYGVSCGTSNCNYGLASPNMAPETDRTLTTE